LFGNLLTQSWLPQPLQALGNVVTRVVTAPAPVNIATTFAQSFGAIIPPTPLVNNLLGTAGNLLGRALPQVNAIGSAGLSAISNLGRTATDLFSRTTNAAQNLATQVANSAAGQWVYQHREQILSTATNIAVGAAIGIGMAAICGATAGIGCIVAGAALAGAASAGSGTIVGNLVGGRDWHQDVVKNTIIGGITGAATAGLTHVMPGVAQTVVGSISRNLNLGSLGTKIVQEGVTLLGAGVVSGTGNAVAQIGNNLFNGQPPLDNVGSSFAQGFGMGVATAAGIRMGQVAGQRIFGSGPSSVPSNPSCAANSFSQDTPVATEEGERPIGDLSVGDRVLAYDEATNTTGYYPITAVLVHDDPVIVHLTIDGEEIETTPEHPFYTQENKWVGAGALTVGMHVRKADGSYGTVQSVKDEHRTQKMYNLTVEQAHTFFVGEQRWLVHNCGGSTSTGQTGRITVSHYTSEEVAEDIMNSPHPMIDPSEGHVFVMEGQSTPQRALDAGAHSAEVRIVFEASPYELEVDPEIAYRTSQGLTPIDESRMFSRRGPVSLEGRNPIVEPTSGGGLSDWIKGLFGNH